MVGMPRGRSFPLAFLMYLLRTSRARYVPCFSRSSRSGHVRLQVLSVSPGAYPIHAPRRFFVEQLEAFDEKLPVQQLVQVRESALPSCLACLAISPSEVGMFCSTSSAGHVSFEGCGLPSVPSPLFSLLSFLWPALPSSEYYGPIRLPTGRRRSCFTFGHAYLAFPRSPWDLPSSCAVLFLACHPL